MQYWVSFILGDAPERRKGFSSFEDAYRFAYHDSRTVNYNIRYIAETYPEGTSIRYSKDAKGEMIATMFVCAKGKTPTDYVLKKEPELNGYLHFEYIENPERAYLKVPIPLFLQIMSYSALQKKISRQSGILHSVVLLDEENDAPLFLTFCRLAMYKIRLRSRFVESFVCPKNYSPEYFQLR